MGQHGEDAIHELGKEAKRRVLACLGSDQGLQELHLLELSTGVE